MQTVLQAKSHFISSNSISVKETDTVVDGQTLMTIA